MSHSDAVADRDSVEDDGRAAGSMNLSLDVFANGVQMDVAGYDVGIAVGDADERPSDLRLAQADAFKEAPVRPSLDTFFDPVTSHCHTDAPCIRLPLYQTLLW